MKTDQYARGFRSCAAAGKRLLHEMADQLDHRTSEDAFAGKPPSMAVQKLRLAAQRVGALQPPGRNATELDAATHPSDLASAEREAAIGKYVVRPSRSGVPITKGKNDAQ